MGLFSSGEREAGPLARDLDQGPKTPVAQDIHEGVLHDGDIGGDPCYELALGRPVEEGLVPAEELVKELPLDPAVVGGF